jgi:hypothetical protein
MSYAVRKTTGDAPSVTRQPALAKLALAIAFVVVITAATVLIAMGSGAGTHSNASSDRPQASPFPGLSQQAERAVPGKSSAEAQAEAGAIRHPRAAPPVVHTPPWPG